MQSLEQKKSDLFLNRSKTHSKDTKTLLINSMLFYFDF